MTTDPFTEAARAEAEDYARTPLMNVGTVRDRIAEAHQAGAVWARTHLAAQEGHRRVRKYADDWDTCTCGYDAWPCRSQEPTDAEVEAAEEAIDCLFGWEHLRRYGGQNEEWMNRLRKATARAALSAARAAQRDEEKR